MTYEGFKFFNLVRYPCDNCFMSSHKQQEYTVYIKKKSTENMWCMHVSTRHLTR